MGDLNEDTFSSMVLCMWGLGVETRWQRIGMSGLFCLVHQCDSGAWHFGAY